MTWDNWQPYTSPKGWAATRRRILRRDNGTCNYCGAPATAVDHTIPVSQGGTHTDDNLAAICKPCHNTKTRREQQRPKPNPPTQPTTKHTQERHPGLL